MHRILFFLYLVAFLLAAFVSATDFAIAEKQPSHAAQETRAAATLQQKTHVAPPAPASLLSPLWKWFDPSGEQAALLEQLQAPAAGSTSKKKALGSGKKKRPPSTTESAEKQTTSMKPVATPQAEVKAPPPESWLENEAEIPAQQQQNNAADSEPTNTPATVSETVEQPTSGFWSWFSGRSAELEKKEPTAIDVPTEESAEATDKPLREGLTATPPAAVAETERRREPELPKERKARQPSVRKQQTTEIPEETASVPPGKTIWVPPPAEKRSELGFWAKWSGWREQEDVKCPPGHTKVQSPSPITSNGCGVFGFEMKAGDYEFTRCCDLHDACFVTCGVTHDQCEGLFRNCMMDYCDRQGGDREDCRHNAALMLAGSWLLSSKAFALSQEDACSCEPQEWVTSRYTNHFQRIYDIVGTLVGRSAVDELVANVKKVMVNPGKEWEFLLRTLIKYPEAIEGSAANKILEQKKLELKVARRKPPTFRVPNAAEALEGERRRLYFSGR